MHRVLAGLRVVLALGQSRQAVNLGHFNKLAMKGYDLLEGRGAARGHPGDRGQSHSWPARLGP